MNWIILIIGILMGCALLFCAPDASHCAFIILAMSCGMVCGAGILLLANEGN